MKNAVKDVIKDTNAKKHEEALTKQADTEAQNKQVKTGNNTSIPLNTSRPELPQTNNRAKSDDTKLSTRAKTPFSNLSSLQLESFASPYIETKVKPGSQKTEKKIITWYKPENVREINRKRKAMENCPESACKVMYPLPEGVVADAIIFDGVDKQGPPPARVHPDQVRMDRVSVGVNCLIWFKCDYLYHFIIFCLTHASLPPYLSLSKTIMQQI